MLQTSEISICCVFHVTKLSSAESKQFQSSSFAQTSSPTTVKFQILLVEVCSQGLRRAHGCGSSLEEGASEAQWMPFELANASDGSVLGHSLGSTLEGTLVT